MKQVHSEEIEFYGKTIEEAIKKAVKQLNVPRETLKIKVLTEEKKGLFGMQGEKPAKIIVSIIKK